MTYKSSDKSFFEEVFEKPVSETQEEISQLEKRGKRKFLKLYDFGATKLRDEIKRKPGQYFFLFLTSFLGSMITTAAALIMFSGNLVAQFVPKPEVGVQGVQVSEKIEKIENFDPLLLASKILRKEKGFEVIDIRSEKDFIKGHIVGSKNVPVYDTGIVDQNGDIDKRALHQAFKKYLSSDDLLIIYAQNSYSTLPAEIASLFSTSTKRVKALAVGWEEWLHLNSKR